MSPQGPEIEIPFALLSIDEMEPTFMTPCMYMPIAGPGGAFRASGLLELDPLVNAGPSYVLAVQVENLLPAPPLTDGPPPPEPSPDFLYSGAVITYVVQQSFLAPGVPPQATVPLSGRVQPGGPDMAAAVLVQTMGSDVVAAVSRNLEAEGPGAAGDLILEVQLFGTLSTTGEQLGTTVLSFPLHVCIDCGADPLTCVNGVTAAPSGHGPCCAPQDFLEVCVACGGVGEPCCAPPDGVPLTCSRDADCQSAYGASSICDADAGVCTPGCNADPNGKPMACVPNTSLPEGTEDCSYLNSGALLTSCATL